MSPASVLILALALVGVDDPFVLNRREIAFGGTVTDVLGSPIRIVTVRDPLTGTNRTFGLNGGTQKVCDLAGDDLSREAVRCGDYVVAILPAVITWSDDRPVVTQYLEEMRLVVVRRADRDDLGFALAVEETVAAWHPEAPPGPLDRIYLDFLTHGSCWLRDATEGVLREDVPRSLGALVRGLRSADAEVRRRCGRALAAALYPVPRPAPQARPRAVIVRFAADVDAVAARERLAIYHVAGMRRESIRWNTYRVDLGDAPDDRVETLIYALRQDKGVLSVRECVEPKP